MAVQATVVCLEIFCCLIFFSTLASCITLAPTHSSLKSRTLKLSQTQQPPGGGSLSTPPPKSVATDAPGISVYRFRSSPSDVTCILLKTDGLIEVYFMDHNEKRQISEYMPDEALVEGNCKYEDSETMTVTWPGHKMIWLFGKTPGREGWFIKSVELIIDSSISKYKDLHVTGKSFRLAHRKMLIPTPTGKSFICPEYVIDLNPEPDDDLPPGIQGKLFLRSLQLQPFMFKGEDFGPEFDCNKEVSFRDETAPIAVGSTLAIAVLATVTGYGVFRYFKVKKVQYNTMG